MTQACGGSLQGDLLQSDVPAAPLVHPQKDVQGYAGAECRLGKRRPEAERSERCSLVHFTRAQATKDARLILLAPR